MKVKVIIGEPATNEVKLIAAIDAGEVDGDVYADGEIWVDPDSFHAWAGPQPEPVIDVPADELSSTFTDHV